MFVIVFNIIYTQRVIRPATLRKRVGISINLLIFLSNLILSLLVLLPLLN
ncbi:uncharacterized protein K441DRAFT_726743 [Cenococcum geophilum 1.58]|nr:hypothetical protein K441DRAFT_726743 [Cenococcum geophilum 1.58]